MASNWTVYLPDRREPVYYPSSLTTDEVRQVAIGSGHTSVDGASMEVNGAVITFRRPTGGNKGF